MVDKKTFKQYFNQLKSEGKYNSKIMFKNPTSLEKKLQAILDDNQIKYVFQKLFYKRVEGTRDCIEAYYIANFWIPQKRIVLNVEAAPRKNQPEYWGFSTKDFSGIVAKSQVLNISRKDFECPTFVDELVAILK